MNAAYFVLLLAVGTSAAPETVLKVERIQHVLVLTEVYLNGAGPYRMMIDTGSSSSVVRPSIARKLGLRPSYAVEQETCAGVHRVPAALLDAVRTGSVTDESVEVMIADVRLPGVDGVLGQSWLARHDYQLDYRQRRLVLDGAPPAGDVRVALRSVEGRPAIAAEVDSHRRDLVVDSGASALILFERRAPIGHAMLLTDSDSIAAETGTANVAIGERYSRRVTAARVNATRPESGLLPACMFATIYISNRAGVVVLAP